MLTGPSSRSRFSCPCRFAAGPLLLLALGSFLFAGCGGGNGSPSGAGPVVNAVFDASYITPPAASDTLTYQTTTTQNVNGTVTSNTATTTALPGAFGTGRPGNTTTAVVNGVTVTRQELWNDQGTVTGYTYYLLDNSGYHVYGVDTLDADAFGFITTSRYSPPLTIPLGLTSAQTASQSVQVALTRFQGSQTTSNTYTLRYTFALLGFETKQVTAGTFANCAHYTISLSYPQPPGGAIPAVNITSTTENWVAPRVGVVAAVTHSQTMPAILGQSYNSTTDTNSTLLSATVGGTSYP